MCIKSGNIPFPLKARDRAATLAGGTVGSTQAPKERPPVSSAGNPTARIAQEAVDALSAMIAGFLGGDRELLDRGFEDLVGSCEEMRDAVPKA